MDIAMVFGIASVVIFLGFFGEYIFEKTKIPDAIWLIIFGLVLGHFVNIRDSPDFQQIGIIFTTFALIFLLFEGVLKVNLKELFIGFAEGTGIYIIHFVLTLIITALVMLTLGWGILEGLLLGVILGDTAQAIIIPLTKKLKIKSQTMLILMMESTISDVFCIVGALALINIMMLKSVTVSGVVQQIAHPVAIGIIVGLVMGLIWIKVLPLLNKFSKSYMTTIAVLLLLYGGVEYFVGGGGIIACLVFGVMVGNTKQIFRAINKETRYNMDKSARFFYSQISFFLKTFFFVYIGMSISFDQFISFSRWNLVILGGWLAVLIFLIRPISVWIGFKKRADVKERSFLEVLNPKGLLAVVLAQLPVQYGLPHAEMFATIVLSAVAVSIFISAIGTFLVESGHYHGLYSMFKRRKAKPELKTEE